MACQFLLGYLMLKSFLVSSNYSSSSSSSHAANTDFPDSLSPSPAYHPSLPVGVLDYILCPYRAVVGKFFLVGQHWHIRVKESIGECFL